MSHIEEITQEERLNKAFIELYTFLMQSTLKKFIPSKDKLFEIYAKLLINTLSLINGCSEIGQGKLLSYGSNCTQMRLFYFLPFVLFVGLYIGASVIDHSCAPNAVYYISEGM